MSTLIDNLKKTISNIFQYKPDEDYHFTIPETQEEKALINNSFVNTFGEDDKEDNKQTVFYSIDDNLEYVKVKYNFLINSDIKIREFSLRSTNRNYKAFLLFIDGMIDSTSINDFILKPLMLKNSANSFDGISEIISSNSSTNNVKLKKEKNFNLENHIFNSLVPQSDTQKTSSFEDILSGVNFGSCALFVDTLNVAFLVDVKGFEKRSVSPPINEVVIRGSQEAFIESIRTNTSLLRRFVNNENLIIENVSVGAISKTKCAICYLGNIANNELVSEVKYRLNNISIDYLLSSGQLEQLISDNPKSSLPQMIATERPDNVSNYLLEGRVAVIVNGSPFALVMPSTFADFMTSIEDTNLNYKFSDLLRIVRILAALITLLLPGIYVAVSTYHQELLPTELLFSIVAARQSVPFPIILEILIMEVSFELIREAGLRVPSSVGTTMGIVGALVLGEAAVSASIVSPILVIVVAITGITSFAIPNFSLSFHFRISRFAYLILGALFGFLGIAIGLFIHISTLCSLNSFGVPYLAPYVPTINKKGSRYIFPPIWKREQRNDFLNTKKINKQEHISMKWRMGGRKEN